MRTITASSVVLAVADEAIYRLVRRGGLRLQGRRCDTGAYEETRPDVRCDHCSGWGQSALGLAAGVRRSTRRRTVGAPLRGARSRRVSSAVTLWPSVQIARGPTSRRLTPARRSKRRPAVTQRGGGPPPPSGGSEARPRGQKTHQPPPRGRETARGMGMRFGTSPIRGRRWRSRRGGLRQQAGEARWGP